MSGVEDSEHFRSSYRPPHSGKHPIPTIAQYKNLKDQQRAQIRQEGIETEDQQPGQLQAAWQAGKDYWNGSSESKPDSGPSAHPADSQQTSQQAAESFSHPSDAQNVNKQEEKQDDEGEKHYMEDTTEQAAVDPKTKRKTMKHRSPEDVEREVTDPVTHLPVTIHDFASKDVKRFVPDVEEDELEDDESVPTGSSPQKTLKEQGRAESSLDHAKQYQQTGLRSMLERFPPPDFEAASHELGEVYNRSTTVTFVAIATGTAIFAVGAPFLPTTLTISGRTFSGGWLTGLFATATFFTVGSILWTAQTWSRNQVQTIWEDAVWSAQHSKAKQDIAGGARESTLWFSKIIGSIWPLINPDLFISVADTLEDVMQASLPSLVRMVSVDDIGQGSEPIRIIGVNWLPKGAASKSVTNDGDLSDDDSKKNPDDNAAGENEGDPRVEAQQDVKDDKPDPDSSKEALEAEEGEFVNLEIAFAYRASRFQRKKERSKNAHIYLSFYLPGNIKLPVWVEVKGIVGVARARLQLTPDPPFVAMCTLSFMGQPKVDMTCVPLLKSGLNIMDLPIISNFVQSAIDAALSEYVAPKSISLDLHAMLVGDDFKRDTVARGVMVVRILRCFDFKAGDAGIPLIRPEGSSDSYVSVGWAKFGKPLWSTRVIADEMEPYWYEEAYIPVGPEELDAGESLRVQLWDSDKFSADDDQGRIELSLKGLMTNENSNGKMWLRTDPFKALQADKEMPGRCEWSVGYFSKTRLLQAQIEQQEKDKSIRSIDQLKQQVYKEAERKLRETAKDEHGEIEQQRRDDWQAKEIQMISDSLPPEDYPSGILSIQIHQIVGLNLQQISQTGRDVPEGDNVNANEDENQLADSYCTLILNHKKIFKTRTKPKNATPFFNAATERFIRDWRNTDLTLSVRDARVHENDPLIGFVHFNLGEHFRNRRTSHSIDFYPISGGIGYGRARVSLCFRSVQLQSPSRSLGWEMGTIELGPEIWGMENLATDLRKIHLRISTDLELGRVRAKHHLASTGEQPEEGAVARWKNVGGRPLLLSVQRRYASCVFFEFRNRASFTGDKCPACAVLWLSQLTDNEEEVIDIPVWRTTSKTAVRLHKNTLPEELCGEKLGSLRIRVGFWRGMGRGHAKRLGKRNLDIQNVVEVLQAANDQGLIGPLVGDRNWKQCRLEHGESKDATEDETRDADNDEDANADSDSGDDSSDSSDDDDKGKSSKKKGKKAAKVKVTPTEIPHTPASAKQAAADIDVLRTHPASVRPLSYASHSGKAQDEGTPRSSMADTPPSRSQSIRNSIRNSGIFGSANDYMDNRAQLHRQHRGIMQWKGPRTLSWMKNKADKAVDSVTSSFEHHGREPDVETEV